jgi:hypothetical protein
LHKSFSSWNDSFFYCDLSEFVNCEGWWCRLGWLIRFISHSIISGFTTGSAVIIGLSQAKNFLGYDVTGSSKFIPLMESIISGLPQVILLLFSMHLKVCHKAAYDEGTYKRSMQTNAISTSRFMVFPLNCR